MQVRAYQTTAVVLQLMLPAILDPSLPLLRVWADLGMGPDDPVDIVRDDGTRRSESLHTWLARAAADGGRGLGLGSDVVSFGMVYATTRIGDDVDRLNLRDASVPLMEFLRHLRNACAHGNRWHLTGQEPRNPAVFRQLVVDRTWHGQRAVHGNVGPAEYLDFLDDLADHFDSLS